MEQAKYFLNQILNLPLLPILYFQSKTIRKNIPQLPEAKNPNGIFKNGNRELNLISIGESTIAGVGVATHQKGFTGHLALELSKQLQATIHWQVIAKSGYTAKKVNANLIPNLVSKQKDIIIIGLGGNDTFKMNTPKQWKQELEILIKELKIKFPGTPILFSNVPPIRSFPAFSNIIKFVLGKQVDLLHSVLKKVADQNDQVWFIEDQIKLNYWLKHFQDKNYTAKDFFSDGIHPSELTYKTWGIEAANFIIKEQIIK